MTPLIDGDILVYEVGSVAEYGWDEIPPFTVAESFLISRIDGICSAVGATEPPIIYLTGKDNFRNDIAKRKPYKGNRKDVVKPYHYRNIIVYLKSVYGAIVVEGMEADDAMCIEQTKRLEAKDTIICTRDKDLRQCPGWHYGWESGKQGEFYPRWVDELGELEKNEKGKVVGTGLKFFYTQILTGDTVDNIPGCPKIGPVKAYNALADLNTEAELYQTVLDFYLDAYDDETAEAEMYEQAQLVWMVRELDPDGNPIMWRKPNV